MKWSHHGHEWAGGRHKRGRGLCPLGPVSAYFLADVGLHRVRNLWCVLHYWFMIVTQNGLFIIDVFSRVSAHGYLKYTDQKTEVGAYLEKPFVCI